ncbi:MAG TPA: sigma-70 family RNA polymerase sigma factor [Rhodanobacteraceae bacterium]|nr:sigma-70 family RNA polymerase sigma factor [Rhodanobacteraceae bacterium]
MASRQRQFDALVRAHTGDLFRYAYWLCGDEALAQDLAQETFLRAWRSLDTLRDTAAAKAWLITILRREHARLYERKQFDTTDISELELDDREALTPEQIGEDAIVRAAMQKLDPKYREPLLLQVLGGLSCEEIASELELSSAAVMTQLFRARQKLKALLSGSAGEAKAYGMS